MKFDIIIPSYAINERFEKITKDCIESIHKTSGSVQCDILILENGRDIKYESARTIFHKEKKFNYNKYMNYGISQTKNPYIICCNNDLIFKDGWADEMLKVFDMGYQSLSPRCGITHKNIPPGPHIIEGYQVGVHVAGWCIGVSRSMIADLGGFNEGVDFWYSDNLYSEQLQIAKVVHALVCSSRVDHVERGSRTLTSLPGKQMMDATSRQYAKYQKALQALYDGKA